MAAVVVRAVTGATVMTHNIMGTGPDANQQGWRFSGQAVIPVRKRHVDDVFKGAYYVLYLEPPGT